jgi:hypothetical protein
VIDTRTEVVISDSGDGNPRRLPVFGVQATWEVSNVGAFSCFARVEDLRRAGLGGSLGGSWLTWNGGLVGRWGGLISGRPLTPGVTELAAEGWGSLLRGHVIDSWLEPGVGQYAGIAWRGILSAQGSQAFITIGTLDEGGEAVDINGSGQDIIDDLTGNLADGGMMEWEVDQDRVFHAGRRIGQDRSPRYRLVEGRHIVDFRGPVDDLWAAPPAEVIEIEGQAALTETITHTAALGLYQASGEHRRRHQRRNKRNRGHRPNRRRGQAVFAERKRHPGPSATSGTTTWTTTEIVTPPIAGGPIEAYEPPATVPFELDLVNRDNCFGWLQAGDSVRILLGSVGFAGIFRCMVRGIDMDEGVMTLAGEVLTDGARDT